MAAQPYMQLLGVYCEVRACVQVSVVETCPLGASATAQHTFTTPQASMQAVQDECVVLHESVRQAQEALGKMCAAAQQYEQVRGS